MLNSTYLIKIYKSDKPLFFGITFFFLFTIAFNLIKFEVTPFFLWGMYSEKVEVPESIDVVKVSVNNGLILDISSDYTSQSRFYLNSPLKAYIEMKELGGIDKAIRMYPERGKNNFLFYRKYVGRTTNDTSHYIPFKEWYRRYIESVTCMHIDSICVERIRIHYDKNGRLQADSVSFFEKFKYLR